ncbi:MAG: HGxxPAAW family protein [Marmoricola sp.]
MTAHHGSTPAAWTAVTIALAGFVVGAIGLMAGSMPTFWVGVALAPAAIIVGVVMSRMGYGTAG